ncbi:MAG TPA: hypothetical protein VH598_05745 [Verrucomicrobiae bacterium]|nr:hypothetical protein [Verrucomicrobiae bacterium]
MSVFYPTKNPYFLHLEFLNFFAIVGANYESMNINSLKSLGLKRWLRHGKLWSNRIHHTMIWVIDSLGPLMVYFAD